MLSGLGFNCEDETHAAYVAAGADPAIVSALAWLRGDVKLDAFDVLHVSGGFTFSVERTDSGWVVKQWRSEWTAKSTP